MIQHLSIFPTPIKLVKNFLTEEERENIIDIKEEEYDNPTMADLAHTYDIKDILTPIKERAEIVCKTLGKDLFGQELEWRITNMWRNNLSWGGKQLQHCHCNAFISGVIYVNLPPGAAKTKFHRPLQNNSFIFKNDTTDFNEYNTEWVTVEDTEELDMILFPSYIKHSVDEHKVEENRVSLAFNAIPDRLSFSGYEIEFK